MLRDAKQLIYIHPEASLYEAIKTLIHNKIHRQGGRILVEKINWIESFVLKKINQHCLGPFTCFMIKT